MIPVLFFLTIALLLIKLKEYKQPGISPDSPDSEDSGVALQDEHPVKETTPETSSHSARVAIIIDDIGNDRKVFRKFLDLGIPLTFSILPHEKFSSRIAEEANRLNYEIILHLPMEPKSQEKNPGNGVILQNMSEDEMLRQLRLDIEAVPHITGINNHMGSLLTEDRTAMNILLQEIQRKGLFFLDSRTSPDSVAYEIAKDLGIKSETRDVFLDNSPDIEYIKGQIDKAIKIAKKHGEVTVIGHPRKQTIAALREKMSDFEKEGIDIVSVSEILD